EELGLDHFEGRSWQGLHRHALMTMIAYAFLQFRRLAAAKRKKKNQRPAAQAKLARRTARHSRALRPTTATTMPSLPKFAIQKAAAMNKFCQSSVKEPGCVWRPALNPGCNSTISVITS